MTRSRFLGIARPENPPDHVIFSYKMSFPFVISLNKQLQSISGTNKHRKRHLI